MKKKCNQCGKPFETDDKRVKKCDMCRFGKVHKESENELLKNYMNSTARINELMRNYRRKQRIKKIVLIALLVAVEIANIVMIIVK